jgi:hypothetical protein
MKLDLSQQAAMNCEKDIIPNADQSLLSIEAREEIKELKEQGISWAIGKNRKYGYFILSCGQGPMFIWTEKN